MTDGPVGPSSDVRIVATTVDANPLHNGPIVLAEYDPRWPRLFEREAARIRSILGERAMRLEHVGSTSVPGLAAKPIIDLLLVVADSSDEPSYVPPLEAAGYVLRIREPDWHEHRVLKGPDTDINLHVFSPGSPEIHRTLAFRDRLRESDPSGAVRADEAGARREALEVRAELRGRQVPAAVRGDHGSAGLPPGGG